MNKKDIKDKFIKTIIKKYIKKEENIIYVGRAFMALSVVNHALDKNLSPKEINLYLQEAVKYPEGVTDLIWEDGVIKSRRDDKK